MSAPDHLSELRDDIVAALDRRIALIRSEAAQDGRGEEYYRLTASLYGVARDLAEMTLDEALATGLIKEDLLRD